MSRALKAVTDDGARTAPLGEIVDALELDLVLGRIRPRERLTEDDLMARFNAKRHVIRNALIELERVGLVERPRGKGAVVRDYDLDEVTEIFEFRADLHRLAVSHMTLPLDPTVLKELRSICDAHEAAIEEDDLATVIQLNNAFHDLFFDQCGNRYLSDAIRHHAALSHAIRSYRVGDPALLQQAVQEHRQILQQAERGDYERLTDLCARHIEPSRDMYLKDMRFRDKR